MAFARISSIGMQADRIRADLRQRFQRWALRGRAPEPVPVILGQRRVYVLPTGAGLAYAVALVVMLLGAINYSLSLGHALVFLLVGLGIAAILNTFRNLAHLRITTARCPPVFAGQDAHFGLVLHNPSKHVRLGITLHTGTQAPLSVDLPAQDSLDIALPVPAKQRGWLALPRVTLATTYPLGLVRTWAYAEPALRCLVYPAPAVDAPPLPRGGGQNPGRLRQGSGNDDFAGLRSHIPGEPLQHVAWKAAARQPEGELLAKHFAGESGDMLWLDWQALPSGLDNEARIAVLTRWVLDAQAGGGAWGLRLPGRTLPPVTGEAHLHRCLEALALHGQPTPEKQAAPATTMTPSS
ncbi:MAG TPA: DUF58 domain-containing protein [Rhodocyclaceae bacterium]|jgi:uncharacterized protein (DUF58 family)|nr:DUF58 domain-containing protein [Rhodocyclaceae bacterium]